MARIMPHPYDATGKHMVQTRPSDWIALGGLPPGTSLAIVDADLSVVSAAADKLIRVDGPNPYCAHFEFQAGPDPTLDRRVMVYNVLAEDRLDMPVWSVVFLLRPQALTTGVTGAVRRQGRRPHKLIFSYKLVRVWEIPAKTLLSGGLGTLPLAPIGAVSEPDLGGVVDAMRRRLDRETTTEEAAELWTATRILMGLRWPPDLVGHLLKGVQGMKESTTYQEILREGIEQGRRRGASKGSNRADSPKPALSSFVWAPGGSARRTPPCGPGLEAMTDLRRLEDLAERSIEGQAGLG